MATSEKISTSEKRALEKSGMIPDNFEYPVVGMFDPPPSWILRGSFATTKYFFVVGRGEGQERGGTNCLDAFQDAAQCYERCNLEKPLEQLEVRCYWEEILVMKQREPRFFYRVAILYRFPLAKGDLK
ncbi:hypothetical protein HY625_03045 [Candidatus Uhrbacteria bacterium]|nr:hypothetical protein [Candidatus Uhrbacteria bacterium]